MAVRPDNKLWPASIFIDFAFAFVCMQVSVNGNLKSGEETLLPKHNPLCHSIFSETVMSGKKAVCITGFKRT